MSAFPSLPLFTDAFLADTGHLTAQETGAYLLLLMVAWRLPECALPDDDTRLARWARCELRTWRKIKPAVMSFWTLAEGAWTQKRLSKEREIVSKRAEVARGNGAAGGRPKSLKTNDSENPTGSAGKTQKKAPNPISKKDTEGSLRSPSGAGAPPTVPIDPREACWAEGVPLLCAMGCSDREARSNIGRFLKSHRPSDVLGAIYRARDHGSRDPIPLVGRILKPLENPRASDVRQAQSTSAAARRLADQLRDIEAGGDWPTTGMLAIGSG